MKKRILITGAGSGFGEGVAFGLAKEGHEVIAGVYIWPQLTKMRKEAESRGLTNLRVEKLNILDPFDVAMAAEWDIDILVNNAAIGFGGPVCEIPLDLVRRTFETNVFAGLNLSQKFIRRFVDEKRSGKIVFVSSIAGLAPVPGLGAYSASKHALEAIAEALQTELKSYGIQVQTINPGAYLTGFNDTMAETSEHWMDDEKNFFKKDDLDKLVQPILSNQNDPQEAIDAMISIIPEFSGNFRNVFPKSAEALVKEVQEEAWDYKVS
ncbi:SDR family oxidoreductase [Candidatus Dependentiae bacterium]|nr:SDR family oxidoreductase [Candidatus Dependentiae bacterium]